MISIQKTEKGHMVIIEIGQKDVGVAYAAGSIDDRETVVAEFCQVIKKTSFSTGDKVADDQIDPEFSVALCFSSREGFDFVIGKLTEAADFLWPRDQCEEA